jgi:hypothetical protein
MKNDSNEILNSLLADWFRWARGYKYVAEIGSQPMFKECRSNHRQWATLDEVADEDKSTFEAMDAIIMNLCEVYRTSLQIQARNLATGRNVWNSERLPKDPEMRAHLLADARTAVKVRLRIEGIM